MGQQSQVGQLAVRTQSVEGTFPADFATNAFVMPYLSGAPDLSRDPIVPDPEIGGHRDVPRIYAGPGSWAGDIEFYPRMNSMLTWLYAAFGNKAVKNPGGTSEVTTLTATGTVSGGTFTITYSAQTTSAIPWNAPPDQVQVALEALSNIAPGDVFVSGGPFPATPYTLTWMGTLIGNVTAPTVDVTNLTGSTPGINVATAVAGTDYTGAVSHTFWPSDSSALPFLGLEIRKGSTFHTDRFTDCVVDSLKLEVEPDGILKGTVSVICKRGDRVASAISPSGLVDTGVFVVGCAVTVSYGGVAINPKSLSLEFNNNFDSDDFRLGSFYLADLTPKRRDVTVSMTVREADDTQMRTANYGSPSANALAGTVVDDDLIITFSTYDLIPGATPSIPFSLQMIFPSAVITPYSPQASGDDVLDSEWEIRAIRPIPALPIVTAKVDTNTSTVK